MSSIYSITFTMYYFFWFDSDKKKVLVLSYRKNIEMDIELIANCNLFQNDSRVRLQIPRTYTKHDGSERLKNKKNLKLLQVPAQPNAHTRAPNRNVQFHKLPSVLVDFSTLIAQLRIYHQNLIITRFDGITNTSSTLTSRWKCVFINTVWWHERWSNKKNFLLYRTCNLEWLWMRAINIHYFVQNASTRTDHYSYIHCMYVDNLQR